MEEKYKKTVQLLLEILPYVMADDRFALKGGTAINLFFQNLPRYSIDIDLCYLPIEDRDTTYENIHAILKDIKSKLEKINLDVASSNNIGSKKEVKLLVKGSDGITIKVEPNFVLRGSVFSCSKKKNCQKVKDVFKKELEVKCLSYADLYGGKIVASLDRQHPRDIFDIKILLEENGINEDVKNAFIYYLISHNRPINEVLEPKKMSLAEAYNNEFLDMTVSKVTLEELENTREKLIHEIKTIFTEADRKFILGFVKNNPDWSLVFDDKIKDYPSVRWKLLNQQNMDSKKLNKYIDIVGRCLEI